MDQQLPPLDGKLIFVYYSASATAKEHGVAIDNGHFETQGNRLFIAGTVVSTTVNERDEASRHWNHGLQVAVAWDSVYHYYIFDSIEDHDLRFKGYASYKSYDSSYASKTNPFPTYAWIKRFIACMKQAPN
jgi:hypothetical protein